MHIIVVNEIDISQLMDSLTYFLESWVFHVMFRCYVLSKFSNYLSKTFKHISIVCGMVLAEKYQMRYKITSHWPTLTWNYGQFKLRLCVLLKVHF